MSEMFLVTGRLVSDVWSRLRALDRDQRGYSTEAVVITAALAAVALVVVGIIAAKITSTANGISTK